VQSAAHRATFSCGASPADNMVEWGRGRAPCLPCRVPAEEPQLAAVGGEVQRVHLHADRRCVTQPFTQGTTRRPCLSARHGALQTEPVHRSTQHTAGMQLAIASPAVENRTSAECVPQSKHSAQAGPEYIERSSARSYFFSNSPVRCLFTNVVLPVRDVRLIIATCDASGWPRRAGRGRTEVEASLTDGGGVGRACGDRIAVRHTALTCKLVGCCRTSRFREAPPFSLRRMARCQ